MNEVLLTKSVNLHVEPGSGVMGSLKDAVVGSSCRRTIHTTEMNTGGQPLRIIESGFPDLPVHASILDALRYVRDNLDHLRKLLIFEPRGHNDMFGILLLRNGTARQEVEAAREKEGEEDKIHVSAVLMTNSKYVTMCGDAVISLGRYVIDSGLVRASCPVTRVNIEVPCGVVQCRVECQHDDSNGEVRTGAVTFTSVPAFMVTNEPVALDIPGYGSVSVEVAFGGNFYALVTERDLGVSLAEDSIRTLVEAGTAVLERVQQAMHEGRFPPARHPQSDDLSFIYGTIITDGDEIVTSRRGTPPAASTHLVVFQDRAFARSPCGSGVTCRMVYQVTRGYVDIGQTRVFHSAATGTEFSAKALDGAGGGVDGGGVRVEVTGHGYYCGKAQFVVEDGDPLKGGYLPT